MSVRTVVGRVVLSILVVAPLAGCGTMLSDKDFAAAGAEAGGANGATGVNGTKANSGGGAAGGATTGQTIVSGGQAGTQGTDGTNGTQGGTDPNSPGVTTPGGGNAGPNQASDTGVTESAISVGNITAVNGALGPDAFTPLYRGAKYYFQALNEQGGVNGRMVDFQTCDDAESPNQDKSCAQKLIEGQHVFALVGSATDTYAAASYISSQGVPDIGYPIGNAYYKYPTLFSVLGAKGYRDGSAVGVGGQLYIGTGVYRYLKQQVGVSKAAVLFYNIAISKTAGDFIAQGLQTEGIPVAYEPNGGAGILPTQQSYDSDVVAMRNAGVDGIWNAIDVAGFQKLCDAMDRQGFTVKANVATVQGWSAKVGRDFSSPCRNSVYANSTSRPYSETDSPAVAAVIQAQQRYDPGGYLHQWVVEGWAAGKLFTDAVASMGPAPTRQGFVAYVDALQDYTYGDLLSPLDWRTSNDFSQPFNDCFSLGKWDDGAGTFVAAAPTFTCENVSYISYTPGDDGS